MGSVTKVCLTKVQEMASDSPLISKATNIKVNIAKALEKVKASLRPMTQDFMKEAGLVTRCMAEVERPSKMVNASLFTIKQVKNSRPWLLKPPLLQ